MIIKLTSLDIPKHWEVIKYSAVKADMVKEENISAYSINLLFDLLNEKAICLISLNEERVIQRVLIISFFYNEVQKQKGMFFRTLFSFSSGSALAWSEESQQIYNFAIKEECKIIKVTTGNPAINDLAQKYGFIEESKNYTIVL